MKFVGTFVLGIAAIFASNNVAAQEVVFEGADALDLPAGVTALPPLPLPFSERYRFESWNVGKEFVIDVTRIDTALASEVDTLLPVVFVTDNEVFSTMVPGIVRSLELFPSTLVVGISYEHSPVPDREEVVETAMRRSTDLTPIHDEAVLTSMKEELASFRLPVPDNVVLGGADVFLAFINEELKPFLATNYRADVDDATLIGHSTGGLFTLHVLFTSPQSFRRYIALSPPADYGNDILFTEEAKLGDISAGLFIGLGGNDLPGILESTSRLDAQIRGRTRSSLRYSYELFPNESHMSVTEEGITNGLRAVFDMQVE
jgi:uncharacterized protein